MGKYIKRFETVNDYRAYVTDASFETPFVGVCNDLIADASANNDTAPTLFVDRLAICIISKQSSTLAIITDNNDVSLYNFGDPPLASPSPSKDTANILSAQINSEDSSINNEKSSGIYGSNSAYITYVPYIPNAYYGFTFVDPIYGNETVTNTSVITFVRGMPLDTKYYYGEYTSEMYSSTSNDIEYYSYEAPYSIDGYPGNYTGPTISEPYYGDTFTAENGTVINSGDTIYTPIKRAYKLAPGTTIYINSYVD